MLYCNVHTFSGQTKDDLFFLQIIDYNVANDRNDLDHWYGEFTSKSAFPHSVNPLVRFTNS